VRVGRRCSRHRFSMVENLSHRPPAQTCVQALA
jgi:hypothetical protein